MPGIRVTGGATSNSCRPVDNYNCRSADLHVRLTRFACTCAGSNKDEQPALLPLLIDPKEIISDKKQLVRTLLRFEWQALKPQFASFGCYVGGVSALAEPPA